MTADLVTYPPFQVKDRRTQAQAETRVNTTYTARQKLPALNKSHPVEISYWLWGQKVTQKQCLKVQKTQVASAWTC